MKRLIYFLTVFSFISTFNCYTIVEKRIPVKKPSYQNHILIGSWIHKTLWMDSGDQIKRLDFHSNGDLFFYPNSERNNADYYSGRFIITNDTLDILLLNNSFNELFIYKIVNSNLILEKIRNEYTVRFPIIGRSNESWEKVK